MNTQRRVIWGVAAVVIAVLLLLALLDVYPSWVVIGPVCLGVAGIALLVDQVLYSPSRKGGFLASSLMIGLSAGTVAQDAEVVVDEWAVWPFFAAALLVGVPLEVHARRLRHGGTTRPPRHVRPAH